MVSLLLPLIVIGSLIAVRALSIQDVVTISKAKTTYNFEVAKPDRAVAQSRAQGLAQAQALAWKPAQARAAEKMVD
jgi:hypothetical protein